MHKYCFAQETMIYPDDKVNLNLRDVQILNTKVVIIVHSLIKRYKLILMGAGDRLMQSLAPARVSGQVFYFPEIIR